MKEPLIEERSGIKHSKVSRSLDVGDNLKLEGQKVGIRKNHVVELPYVDHGSIFSFALRIKFLDNKDRETEGRMFRRELKTA